MRLEEQLRELAPEVLTALMRRHGDFDRCEDAVQEALLAASRQWPAQGLPEQPKAWLITVASRRWVELWRNDRARARREEAVAALEPPPADTTADGGDDADDAADDDDDGLALLVMCCHPALRPPSQVALTLRAVGGLTTAEIARGLLVPEATIGQRISRAKARLRGVPLALPGEHELPVRLSAVLRVLHVIFTEGSTASSGGSLHRVELSGEAIRLARLLHRSRPGDGEVAGLLALMLLTDARRAARTRSDGTLVPLAGQDRARWDRALIAEGVGLVEEALARAPLGPFQLQAAIAAVHAEATHAQATDWPQVLGLYELLHHLEPGPMTALGRVVAIAEVQGAAVALRELDALAVDPALRDHHRSHSVRAHLLEAAGAHAEARAAYARAAERTLSLPEQRYLLAKADPEGSS